MGPTEIGRNASYAGSKYKDTDNSGFLDDRMNFKVLDNQFQRRKEMNPAEHKPTVKEIGKSKYQGAPAHWFKRTQSGFLEQRFDFNAKDAAFQQRQRMNPVMKNETVEQIGVGLLFVCICCLL